jgi:alpha-L-fucosidase
MKPRIQATLLTAIAVTLFIFFGRTNQGRAEPTVTKSEASGRPVVTMEAFDNYVCPEWFRDAKFGIWSHWGPDSIPGLFNNYAHDLWHQGSNEYKWHLDHYGHPSKAGYREVVESWKAEKFDPDSLVAKYKAAGAKYIVALATHHDNIDCFDSSHHEWNSVKHGPHKDIVGLWRDAALKAGLRFGVSSHADERGWNYMYGAQLSDTNGPLAGVPYQGKDPTLVSLYNTPTNDRAKPSQEWLQEWEKRHVELVDKYHPDLLYFDSGIPHGQYGMNLIAHYLKQNASEHNGVAQAVVNVKAGNFVRDYERGMPTTIQSRPWQDDTSLSGWFYLAQDTVKEDSADFTKNADTVIHTLADVVSKNGNLLMNFPQRGDGSLYPECETVLEELAKWMPINGESIFGTRPWLLFGEGPTPRPEAKFMNELKRPLTWQDVRFTTKGDYLYAIVCGVPQGPLQIKSLGRLGPGFSSIELLGSHEKVQYKFDWEGLTILPIKEWPTQHAVVFKIKLNH